MEGKYRHELKFNISYGNYLILRPRIKMIMQSDPHTDENGTYRIHSIYFDNYTDKILREKIDGVQKREKYRIRWYNDSKDIIILEKKMKVSDLCMKFGTPIPEDVFHKIMGHDYDFLLESGNELLKEFYYRLHQQRLLPSVQVSYIRKPYIYKYGNVRVTFDSEISSSLVRHDFQYTSPLIPAAEEIIMEIKFDEYLPGLITDILQLGSFRQESFSKYMACRKYG